MQAHRQGDGGSGSRAEQREFLSDEKLRQGIELLFFAYRDFTGDPDVVLAERGLGRAHHRTIHFIKRRPGITVAGLLDILQITKQSLNRVLRQLRAEGFVTSKPGATDRRQRNLYLTQAGEAMERELSSLQRARCREDSSRSM